MKGRSRGVGGLMPTAASRGEKFAFDHECATAGLQTKCACDKRHNSIYDATVLSYVLPPGWKQQ